MGEYTGGYTSAVNDISRRRFEDAESARVEDALKEALSLRMRQQKARESAVGEMGIPPPPGGPQPPMPGQASQPGIQAQGQGGPPGPPPTSGMPMPPMQGPQSGMPTPPPGQAGSGMPQPQMMPASWRPSPVSQMRPPPPMGGLPGGGAPGASPAGGASPGMPAPQMMPPPPPKPSPEQIDEAGTKVMPAAGDWVKQTIQSMQKKGKSAGEIADTLEVMKGWHDDSMKDQYNSAIIDLKAKEAATHAYKAEVDRLTAEVKGMTEERRAGDASRKADQNDRKIDLMAQKLSRGGAGGAGGGDGEKLTEGGKKVAAELVKAGKSLPGGWSKSGIGRGNAILNQMAEEEEGGAGSGSIIAGQAAYKADSGSLAQLTKRSDALEQSSKKIDKDIVTLDQFLEKGTAGSVTLINKPINILRTQFSDPELSKLVLAAQIVGTEYERMINGGLLSIAQLHEGAREDAHKLLNGDMTPKQMREIVKVMKQEINNQRGAFKEQLSEVKGRTKGGKEGGAMPVYKDKGELSAAIKSGKAKKGDKFKDEDGVEHVVN